MSRHPQSKETAIGVRTSARHPDCLTAAGSSITTGRQRPVPKHAHAVCDRGTGARRLAIPLPHSRNQSWSQRIKRRSKAISFENYLRQAKISGVCSRLSEKDSVANVATGVRISDHETRFHAGVCRISVGLSQTPERASRKEKAANPCGSTAFEVPPEGLEPSTY
jgi:hypothetical protein